MTISSGPFPTHQPITTRWGVIFTAWRDPDGRVGFRADRDGRTDLVYLALPTDPGNGQPLSVDAYSRPAEDHHPTAAATGTAWLDIIGPATARPWTDGFSVGWHITGLHHTRYVYLTPSIGRTWDGDAADVQLYVSGSDDPTDAGTVLWLPVHERTATATAPAGPVTGPGVDFDPAVFTSWFRTPAVQHSLTGQATSRYDSSDPDDSAGFRVQALLACQPPTTAWRLHAGVSDVRIWPTTDNTGSPAGDGGAVVTFRFGRTELSAGHLDADDLIPSTYHPDSGTIHTTAEHAAIMALTAVATRINDTVHHLAQAIRRTAGHTAIAPTEVAARVQDLAEQYARAHAAAAMSGSTEDHVRAAALPTAIRTTLQPTTPGPEPASRVAVSLVTGWATETIHIDPSHDDALVIVAVGEPDGYLVDIVGVDFTAGTVGIWTGPDDDNRTWTVVQHLDPQLTRPAQAG